MSNKLTIQLTNHPLTAADFGWHSVKSTAVTVWDNGDSIQMKESILNKPRRGGGLYMTHIPRFTIKWIPSAGRFDMYQISDRADRVTGKRAVYTTSYSMTSFLLSRQVVIPSSGYFELVKFIIEWTERVSGGLYTQFKKHHPNGTDEMKGEWSLWSVFAQYPAIRNAPMEQLMALSNDINSYKMFKYESLKVGMDKTFGRRGWNKPMMKALLEDNGFSGDGIKAMKFLRVLLDGNLDRTVRVFNANKAGQLRGGLVVDRLILELDSDYYRRVKDHLLSLPVTRREALLSDPVQLRYYVDAISMFNILNERGVNVDISRCRSGEDYHNLILPIYNRETRAYRYQGVDYDAEIDQEKYADLLAIELEQGRRLIAPKNGHDLINWGNVLSNCIGGYVGKSARKGELLFAIIDKDGQVIGAGEITDRYLSQLLGRFNAQLDNDLVKEVYNKLLAAKIIDDGTSGWGLTALNQ